MATIDLTSQPALKLEYVPGPGNTIELIFLDPSDVELGRIKTDANRFRALLDSLDIVASTYDDQTPRQHARMILDKNAGTATVNFG